MLAIVELGREVGQGRSSRPSIGWMKGAVHVAVAHVARLGHESIDHAVKYNPIVQPAPGKLPDAGNMLGGGIGIHLYHHPTRAQLDQQGVLGDQVRPRTFRRGKDCCKDQQTHAETN